MRKRNYSNHRVVALLFDLGDTLMVEESEVKDAGGTTLQADLVPGMAKALHWFKAQGYALALVADSRPNTPINVLRQHNLSHLFDYLAISEEVGVEKPAPPIFRIALEALDIPESDYGRVAMVGSEEPRSLLWGIFKGKSHLGATLQTSSLRQSWRDCHSSYGAPYMARHRPPPQAVADCLQSDAFWLFPHNLERDVVGANRLGLISIFFHWNDRRRSQPLTIEEEPRYTVSSAQELVSLVASLDRDVRCLQID